jgi:hypothetical protein
MDPNIKSVDEPKIRLLLSLLAYSTDDIGRQLELAEEEQRKGESGQPGH